ncbi:MULTISPECIES: stage IV sporulation protein A [Bacillaceae]|uniref:Stage IV sporulation protein A n=1 Tax=Domibacillus aminovorans TaxID=29332 RepID=A0A177KXU6_9BACI|nr:MULTISPECIES: stage IV sporulation protein A [Bacillaceae]OAH55902.1 stage IV sporulation protein A [Domibacillus aminovorans]OAH58219.1 stage IV sporulation protein A [Domibacillus aminovorans]
MEKAELMKDIAERTEGDIYLGVVGAVRTGKSTFIKRFMELLVLPNMDSESERRRAQDELPQSASGKTIMTTEPKFVPSRAAAVQAGGVQVNIRLVDCVGYVIPEAIGYEDEHGPRMIQTPWFDEPVPFHEAADIGTRKVIEEHSTIGVVVTTDGSFGEIRRSVYVEAEEKAIEGLKEVGKPFIVIINTARPDHVETAQLQQELSEKYDIPVLAMSVEAMTESNVLHVLQEALFEFPVHEVNVHLPSWIMALDESHWLRDRYNDMVKETVKDIKRLRDVNRVVDQFGGGEYIQSAVLTGMDMGQGVAEINLNAPDGLYETIVNEIIGEPLRGKEHLLEIMQHYARIKEEYGQVEEAVNMVRQTGYGVAVPSLADMRLEEPEIIRHGSRYGVRIRAVAPSIHMIKVDVDSEFSPIIGTEKQSEELVQHVMKNYDEDPLSVWESDIFGRNLSSIVREGIQSKVSLMPDNARYKLKDTLEKIINEGSGGMIAILL